MILRMTRVRFQPGKEEAAWPVFAARTKDLRGEPGCRGARFVLAPDHREGMALSWWDSLEQYHAHEATPSYHRFAAMAGEYLAGDPDISWWHVVQES